MDSLARNNLSQGELAFTLESAICDRPPRSRRPTLRPNALVERCSIDQIALCAPRTRSGLVSLHADLLRLASQPDEIAFHDVEVDNYSYAQVCQIALLLDRR
jgi:hypothetical protein